MFTKIETICGDFYRIDQQPFWHLQDHILGLVDQLTNPTEEFDREAIMDSLGELAWGFKIKMPETKQTKL